MTRMATWFAWVNKMNEKIKQLALQAGAVNVWEWASDDVLDTKNMDAEKFAELLIQECASICEINGQTYQYSFTPAKARLAESTSNHCATMIKEHFGVK